MKRPLPLTLLIYALLVAGTVIFSFPFVWMATSSVKVDRELFTKEIRIAPIAPHPRTVSPYVDEQTYRELEGPHQAELLDQFGVLARKTGVALPSGAEQQIARGLYDKLWRRLPKQIWDGDARQIVAAATKEVDATLVKEVLDSVHRRLAIGQIRVRSEDLMEQELGAGKTISQRLDNLTPKSAQLADADENGRPLAVINYDFRNADRVTLSQTFMLDFDAARLQRIQLYLQPDDTWHELWLTVEKNGARYESARPVPLANTTWTTITWREPSEDDTSTKIKTWVLLQKVEGATSSVTDPRQIKLTFELRRSSSARAWWDKVRLNYDRVLDQIPFWRYVRVSIFLVIVSIVLTLFSSSLVAYAFARLQWPGRDSCFLLLLATMMIPGQVTMIPHFLIWKSVGAYNSLVPLWLGHAFGSAFFIFLLRQFLKGIPRDLEDAARIDGCGFWRIYWHIMLPLIKPSLAAIAIFTFMGTWNDFMGPLLYIADQRLYPLAFGLYAFSVQVGNNPALTMAASLLMTLPVIVIFFFCQKYFIQGVTLTGMKG